MSFLIPLLIYGALLIAGRIFKPRIQKPRAIFDVPFAEEGPPLPVVFGIQPVNPMVVEWGETEDVLDQNSGNVFYFAGMTMALCEGQIDRVADIQFGEKSLSAQATDFLTTVDGAISPPFSSIGSGSTPDQFDVVCLDFYGGLTSSAFGVAGVVRVYYGQAHPNAPDPRELRAATAAGDPGAPFNPHVAKIVFDGPITSSNFNTVQRYIDVNSLRFKRFLWGPYNAPPAAVVVVARWPAGPGGTLSYRIVGENDCNGAYALYEMMTNTRWGARIPTASIDTSAFLTAALTLWNEGRGVSFQLNRQNPLKPAIEEVLRHINGIIYRDPISGKYALKLIRGDYEPLNVPQLFEGTDFKGLVVESPLWGEAFSELKIKYSQYGGQNGVSASTFTQTVTAFGESNIIGPVHAGSFYVQLDGRNLTGTVVVRDSTNGKTVTIDATNVNVWIDTGNGSVMLGFGNGTYYIIFDDDFLDNPNTDIVTISFSGQFFGTAFKFVPTIIRFYDSALTQASGDVIPETAEFPYFTSPVAVSQRGIEFFNEASAKLDHYTVKVNRVGNTLFPGMVVGINSTRLGLSSYVVRVVDVDYGDIDDETITVELVTDLYGHTRRGIVFNTGPGAQGGTGGTGQVAPPVSGVAQVPCTSIALQVDGGIANQFTTVILHATDSAGGGATTAGTIAAGTTTFSYTATVSTTHWFAAFHRLVGFTDGAETPWVQMVGATCSTTGTVTCTIPTWVVSSSQGTATGTLTVSVTDPQVRLVSVAFQTQAGTNTPGIFTVATGTTGVYTATVALSCAATSVITYQVAYFDCNGAAATATGSMAFGGTPPPPTVVAHILPGGQLVADWNLPAGMQSIKIAGSFTAQPDSTAVASAAASNLTSGTTDPLAGSQTATAGMTGYVSAIGYAGLNGSGCASTMVQVQITLGAGSVGGVDTISCICVWEPHVLKAGSYLNLPNYPVAETDLADFEGVAGFGHWQQDFGCVEQMTAQLQVHVTTPTGVSPVHGDIALQYGSATVSGTTTSTSWRYWDGVSGPYVNLAGTGVLVGPKVLCETGLFADAVPCRVILRNGSSGTGTAQISMLAVVRCVGAQTHPTATDAGTTAGDCCTAASDGFEYTDTAAMLSAGWSVNGGTAAWAMDTGFPKAGTACLKLTSQYFSNIAFQWKATRTFTLAPNTWYTSSVWVEKDQAYSWDDTFLHLVANGVTSTQSLTATGTYVVLTAVALADSSGHLVITLQRDMPLLTLSSTPIIFSRFDSLRIQQGQTCTATSAECAAKPFVWSKGWGYDQIIFSTATGENNHLVSDGGFGYAYNSNPGFYAYGGYGGNPPIPTLVNDYQVSVTVHAHSPVSGGGGFGGDPFGPNLDVVGGVSARRPTTAGFFNYSGYYFDYMAANQTIRLYAMNATGSVFAVATAALAGGLLETDVTLTLLVQGSTLTGLVNGTASLTLVDTTYTTGGLAGLRAGWKPGQGAYVKGPWTVKNVSGTTTYLTDALTDTGGVVLSNHTPN